MSNEIYFCLITDEHEGNRLPLLVSHKSLALEWLNRHHKEQIRRGHSMLDNEIDMAIEYGREPKIDWTCGEIQTNRFMTYFQTISSRFQIYPAIIHSTLPKDISGF